MLYWLPVAGYDSTTAKHIATDMAHQICGIYVAKCKSNSFNKSDSYLISKSTL